jgi:hypothetical protein
MLHKLVYQLIIGGKGNAHILYINLIRKLFENFDI